MYIFVFCIEFCQWIYGTARYPFHGKWTHRAYKHEHVLQLKKRHNRVDSLFLYCSESNSSYLLRNAIAAVDGLFLCSSESNCSYLLRNTIAAVDGLFLYCSESNSSYLLRNAIAAVDSLFLCSSESNCSYLLRNTIVILIVCVSLL